VPVTLVARAAHAQAIARDGLEIHGVDGREQVRMEASTDISVLRGCTVVLVAVKSPATEPAALQLAAAVPPETLLVSLQNGVDNAWRMRANVTNPVVPAVVYVSVEMREPGVLQHNGGGRLILGDPLIDDRHADAARERFTELVAMLGDAGVPCTHSADVRVDLWTKLTTNCAYNAISALTRLRYGRFTGHAGAQDVIRMVVAEVARVAEADGVPVSEASLWETVERLGAAMPMALSSTAQDLLAHRRTEIDDLNGFVVRRGAALGVPTPVNRTLQALVGLAEVASQEAR
jgi:2-dehydropantoate 2-reductase